MRSQLICETINKVLCFGLKSETVTRKSSGWSQLHVMIWLTTKMVISLQRNRSYWSFLCKPFLIYFLCCTTTVSAKGPITFRKSNNMIGGISKPLDNGEIFLQKNNTESRAQVGATASLHCMLSAPLADGLVSWVRRRDYHLLTVGRQVYSSDKRFGIKVTPDGRNWILTIRWVNPLDAGQYECQVSSHPSQSLMAKLNVVKAHGRILGESERHIHNGSSLRLVCLVEDATEPPVYVFWYRENRMINYDQERGVSVANSQEASVLFIASVTSRDEGNYTCMPSNASPTSVIVHVIRRENPAGLQQEANTEKEIVSQSKPASPIASKAVLYYPNGSAFRQTCTLLVYVIVAHLLPGQLSER